MTFHDLLNQYNVREAKPLVRNSFVAEKILMEYAMKYKLSYPITGNYIDDLFYNYFLLKNTENGRILEAIMNKYGFNYSMSIHNAIYYLLGNERELEELNTDPLLWPGIDAIEENNGVYTLDTILGKVQVSKASEIFKNTSSSYIFDKILMEKCHSRSYDFIKENNENYRVVLSYMPNYFSGGHYHSYLESDTSILDIAANSYYSLKEGTSPVLNGKIIKKLDYKEIERKYKALSKTIPELRGKRDSKLLTLSLYYDLKVNL